MYISVNHIQKEGIFVNFKKLLSIILAVLMLTSALSAGFVGMAASIDYNTQYTALANALKNEHVRELTNYTITNNTLENGTEGFDPEAHGFAYEHRVTAADNSAGDILKAANIFYYIAESLMSYQYGTGYYDAGMLVKAVSDKLRPYFEGADEDYYEDFYGNRFYPTDEQLKEYKKTVSLLEEVGRPITEATLSSFNIYFIKLDRFEYYNVDTILQYFVGNVLKINAGNWYHRFAFVVQTSLDTCLKEIDGVNNAPDSKFVIRTAVYEIDYKRTYNETKSKAYYCFAEPSISNVRNNYSGEFGFGNNESADLSKAYNGLTRSGQAANLYIKVEDDTTTIPYLRYVYNLFAGFIKNPVKDGASWDAEFASLSPAQILEKVPNADEMIAAIEELTSNYSNEAVFGMFGDDIGNMMTLTYILKPIASSPERTVRGTAKYIGSADKLNAIVRDMDALVYDDTSDTAKRVASIVSQFFDTNNSLFEGTAVAGLEFSDLHELVGLLLNGLVFNDKIINAIVEMIYPMLVDLIQDKLIGAIKDVPVVGGLAGSVESLLKDILENNALAIYPKQLGDRIASNYSNGKYSKAVAVLRAAGNDWDKVNFEALSWGVDDADLKNKGSAFVDGFCAALSGFRLLLVTIMCGDEEYENSDRKKNLSWASSNQFTEYYDKLLINIGQNGVLMRSQGLYTKLIVPLLRVFGLEEMPSMNTTDNITGYFSPKDYHKFVDKDGDNCLRLILEPIVYWATEVLAARPFETLWKMVPNLIYFFTRKSDVKIEDDWTEGSSTDDSHDNFTTCQTHSIAEILDHVYLQVTVVGINAYNSSIAGFLGDKMSMLNSLNGLLNEVLSFEYVVGESGVLSTVAYANDAGEAVMPDSFEYATNPDAYPRALQYVYANENETEYRAERDDAHPIEITNPELIKAPYSIPQIQEAKVTSTTTLKADGTMKDPNAIGVLKTEWNTIDVRNPGVVLLWVLRFVISALGYKYDISDTATDKDLPMLIECFGLEIDKDLFQGLNLKDIIYNVMLHPDAAICALLELFYSNESGNYYQGKAYTYPLKKINYHEEVLLDEAINPSKTYGIPVKYSKYWTREYANDTISNLTELIQNVLALLGNTDFADGFGPYIKNMLDGAAFNNGLMNTLFNTIYQLLGGLSGQMNMDIDKILEAALDVTYDPLTIGKTIEAMMGYETPASKFIKSQLNWTELFNGETTTDPVSGETTTTVRNVELDWGIDNAEEHGLTTHDAFLRNASAILSPAAFLFRFLFMDEHLDLLGLIDIDAYAGYQYSIIGLLEMLSCPNILPYKDYYKKGQETIPGTKIGDANVIYYLLKPVLGLLENVYADPITTLLGLVPNLLFFISVGGLNDVLNNLVHFVYVLLDILKPIVNGYDLLNGLLANLNISGLSINLALPLDVDFNGLISDLVGTLVGDSLTIEGVKISLPYIDFHTLCAGTLTKFASKELRNTVNLNAAGGGDLITAVIRLVLEVLFMDENKEAVAQILSNLIGEDENGNPKLDDFDQDTMRQILDELYNLMETYEAPDMILFVVYMLVTKVTPLTGKLAPALAANNISISQLFSMLSSDPKNFVTTLIKVVSTMNGNTHPDNEVTDTEAMGGLFAKIKAFFEKFKLFILKLFGKA